MKNVLKMLAGLAISLIVLAGCSTTYKAHEDSVAAAQSQVAAIEKAKGEAKVAAQAARSARAAAIAKIAEGGSDAVKVAAVMAISFEGVGEDIAGAAGGKDAAVQLPVVTPVASLSERLFTKVLDTVVGLGPLAIQGYMAHVNSQTQIAMSGDNRQVLQSAFGSSTTIATSGFQTAGTIAGYIQAPAANMTLSGTGVIGSGTYTGPVTNTTTTTRTCTGGAAGNGAGTTTGGAGGPGGAATC